MSNITTGDLAQSFQMQRFTSERKAELTRLSSELTTGLKTNLGAALAGDFGPLAGFERSLRAIKAYDTAGSEAAVLLSSAQVALDSVQTLVKDLSPALLTAASARNATLIEATSDESRQKFSAVVARLNTRVADRSLFAGTRTDGLALAPADDMMTALVTATAGLTTADDIVAAVDTWFDDPGGGFDSMGYTGSARDIGPIIIADDETIDITARADGDALRATLKGFAMAALIAEGALTDNGEEQANLIQTAAGRLIAAEGDVTHLRARLGTLEERVENAQARNAAEKSAYELARTELVSADPYETATMLQSVYAQIETLYTITARISALRFTDYMR